MISKEEYKKGIRCSEKFNNSFGCFGCNDKQSCYQYNTTPFLNDSAKINQIHKSNKIDKEKLIKKLIEILKDNNFVILTEKDVEDLASYIIKNY